MMARGWERFDDIDIDGAAARLAGVVRRTPLVPLPGQDPRLDLRGKLENLQETGAFKARGAWNQIAQLEPAGRTAGVVCVSSGNHGKAVAWAAARAGVAATVVMPADAYPNKIQACRDLGAEVILVEGRAAAEAECRLRVEGGRVLIHPYDARRTVEGAGTVGIELAEQWPDLEVLLIPVGGGGLASGVSLAIRRRLGARVRILGVEPAGAPSMTLGLQHGEPVPLERIATAVQGLCPPQSGKLNIEICRRTLDGVLLVEDDAVFAAQARLLAAGHLVEPAGAAAVAAVWDREMPAGWLVRREARAPLRVAAVVSGGNPDPAQVERLRGAAGAHP